MTNIYDGIHSTLYDGAIFGEDLIYDPSGVAITISAAFEGEFKNVGSGPDSIPLPVMLFISQDVLDDNSITLAQDDVVTIRSINYTISELEDDKKGGVIVTAQLQTL